MKIPVKLPETNIVSIHEAEVTGLVRIDGVELHVGGCGEVGHLFSHKLTREGTDLIKGNLVVGHEDMYVLLPVRIPVVYPNDSSWSGVDFSDSGRRDVHDVFQSKMDVTVFEEVHDIVGVLDGGVDSIVFSPFGGLGDELPQIFPFLHLCLEQFVVVWVKWRKNMLWYWACQ